MGDITTGLKDQAWNSGQDFVNWLKGGGAGQAIQGLGQAGQNNMTGSPLDWLNGGGLGQAVQGINR